MSVTGSDVSGGSVRLGDMREVARLELLELLDSFPGTKTLIWDSDLTGPMGLVAEYSVLKQHQVTPIIREKEGETGSSRNKSFTFKSIQAKYLAYAILKVAMQWEVIYPFHSCLCLCWRGRENGFLAFMKVQNQERKTWQTFVFAWIHFSFPTHIHN